MNPGTVNNNERSGDRDLYFSNLFRKTQGSDYDLRQCDCDSLPDMIPQTICDTCGTPIMFLEATRSPEYKSTRYMVAWSQALKRPIPVYCIEHNSAGRFRIEQRYCPADYAPLCKKVRELASEQEFIEWIELLYEFHRKKFHTAP